MENMKKNSTKLHVENTNIMRPKNWPIKLIDMHSHRKMINIFKERGKSVEGSEISGIVSDFMLLCI